MFEDFFSSSLPLVIAAVGGVAAYAVEKAIDRRHVIASVRRDFYSEFLDTWLMRHVSGCTTKEDESRYSRLRLRLYMISSDEVIRAFYKVSSYLDKVGKRTLTVVEASELKQLLAEMILAIRKDCYEKSRLDVDEVTQFMPIKGVDK